MPRFDTLPAWLDWQETLHPKRIDLGLDRVSAVARTLQLLAPSHAVITVAGTNGKGSSAAMLESILCAAGYRVGCYTSPHLIRYNERIHIAADEVTDEQLLEAFDAVDQAREITSLSYFEFGTLAALYLFKQAQLDVAILEVGLGGRLDAVNIIDADVALITSIGIDHTDWLGDDRESIGSEKAGIMRARRPVVCSDPTPPDSVRRHAQQLQSEWYAPGDGYQWSRATDSWSWQSATSRYSALPLPNLPGDHQLQNAAGVLMVLQLLASILPIPESVLSQGLLTIKLAGRCQLIPGAVKTLLDVAHNPDSARQLVRQLQQPHGPGSTRVVLGMLSDKDVMAFINTLLVVTDYWYLASLAGSRGQSAAVLESSLQQLDSQANICLFDSVEAALSQARTDAVEGDRIIVCGSFLTVAEALQCPV